MPQPHFAVPRTNAVTRAARRALLLAVAGSALAVTPALAADEGGVQAGDQAVAAKSTPAATKANTRSAGSTPLTRTTIRAVQRKLRRKPDGVIGGRTRAAVRRFQKRHGLKADGRLWPATLAALGVTTTTIPAPSPGLPGDSGRLLELIAQCESGGDPTVVSASGKHRGKYQFLSSTWHSLGGEGDPAEAPEAEQDQRAGTLLADQGVKPWPTCGRKAKAAVARSAS